MLAALRCNYNLCDVNSAESKIYCNAHRITRKSEDFRTFLEIFSFVLACEQTDTYEYIMNMYLHISKEVPRGHLSFAL